MLQNVARHAVIDTIVKGTEGIGVLNLHEVNVFRIGNMTCLVCHAPYRCGREHKSGQRHRDDADNKNRLPNITTHVAQGLYEVDGEFAHGVFGLGKKEWFLR